jgi:protein-glutamine gamma-glutamyltransferase
VIAQIVLLALPTAFIYCYLAVQFNGYYAVIFNSWVKQGVFFLATLCCSVVFYAYRFRFLTTAVLLGILLIIVRSLVDRVDFGEFDTFYYSVQVFLFSTIIFLSWTVGYGLSRSRLLVIVWSVLLLLCETFLVSSEKHITASGIILSFIPVLAYVFYIIYTSELIRNINENEDRPGLIIVKRLTGFAMLIILLLAGLFFFFRSEFNAIEKEWGGANAENKTGQGKESMTQKDRQGGVGNKDQTRLTGSLDKDKQLVFVARLDNFFPDGKTPNPLYFTSHYYTKFDTLTQTFEKDPRMPYNDLFDPDPSQIPLFFATLDSGVIKRSLGLLNRKVVTAEVYKAALSASKFLAPSTAFYCQPVSVPKDFKDQFRSAYRAKMWVSDLNSAYFIYNPSDNQSLHEFQDVRFQLLRQVRRIEGPSKEFMSYYTYMPTDKEYEKIGELAKRITAGIEAPVDKIIAIRDYFLSKDEYGQPLFRYSDNPGIPGMPSANKLTYFLLENRKGYCAYFAGATLFMLRSLGIPSRVAAGFLTEDRSSKNPGWYWFYQDQAHAWVQAYFQGFGWIDFDTTVPDINTRQAEQPDGTPPTEMQQTWLVADGIINSVDTVHKKLSFSTSKIIYHDKDFESAEPVSMSLDISLAAITTDTGEVNYRYIKPGMHATAISRNETLRDIKPRLSDNLGSIVKRLPSPVAADEIRIMQNKEDRKKSETKRSKLRPADWEHILKVMFISLSSLVLLLFMLPSLIWLYLRNRALRAKRDRVYHINRASLFYLNQVGFRIAGLSPLELAIQADVRYQTVFSEFAGLYQRVKYTKVPASPEEERWATGFFRNFIHSVKTVISFRRRVVSFFNIYNTVYFFNPRKEQQ